MKAVRIARHGGPEVLEVVDLPEPEPGAGEVRVRHRAVGLNFIDTYQRSGLYPVKLPAVPGLEAAGEVEAVGKGVVRLKPGDRVVHQGQPGAYAEACVVRADRAVRLPDDVSFEAAAAVFLKGLTAEFLTRIRPLAPGDAVLVHAAAGGVGSILAPWLAELGARVIGVAGSAEKAAKARANGCAEVLVQGEGDLAGRVRALTDGAGVQVVYDSVGRDTLDASLGCLARRGLMVSFGNASGPARAVEPLELARGGSLFLTRPSLFDYVVTTAELDAAAARLFSVLARGVVRADIGQRFPLAEARAAHEALEGRRTTGSTILLP